MPKRRKFTPSGGIYWQQQRIMMLDIIMGFEQSF